MLNNKGQTLVEYVLIIAIISTFIIGMFFFLKNEFMDQITRLSCGLSGQEYHDGDKRGKGYCEENLGLMKNKQDLIINSLKPNNVGRRFE